MAKITKNPFSQGGNMANIRVFTFNMRTDAPSDGVNWFSGERSAYIGKTFPKYRADIIGCQETTPCMRQWLIDHFHEYEVCGLGREADLQGESNVVCFRREKFDLVTLDQFWLSDTPHVPGSRFHRSKRMSAHLYGTDAAQQRKRQAFPVLQHPS